MTRDGEHQYKYIEMKQCHSWPRIYALINIFFLLNSMPTRCTDRHFLYFGLRIGISHELRFHWKVEKRRIKLDSNYCLRMTFLKAHLLKGVKTMIAKKLLVQTTFMHLNPTKLQKSNFCQIYPNALPTKQGLMILSS